MFVNVEPGNGIEVVDTLELEIKDSKGFFVFLNHKAQIEEIFLGRLKPHYKFNGGLLWINTQQRKGKLNISISYVINNIEQSESNRNSSFFGKIMGHLRNQYVWHPFYEYGAPNDRAMFNATIHIPAEYKLTSSTPQRDTVQNNTRIIYAKSAYPTFALSLYYDKDWQSFKFRNGSKVIELLATKDFEPNAESLLNSFTESYLLLCKAFGEPTCEYICIVQDRSISDQNGWKNRSNDIIIAGEKGGALSKSGLTPRAFFGHEIAHLWTRPEGPATNFLSEGWATYAETYLLRNIYGDTIVPHFMFANKNKYLNNGYNGKSSLWEDYSNNGISYSKGAWLFYMLEQQLGKEAIENTIRKLAQEKKAITIYSFTKYLSESAGKNLWPMLQTWFKSKQIPEINVNLSKDGISFEQVGDIFKLPIEVSFKTKNQQILKRTFNITKRYTIFPLIDIEWTTIQNFTIDPMNKLLFISNYNK
jgi:hypothetical protein